MWQREEVQGEKSQAVKDAETRITTEEEALTSEEREARYQRLTVRQEVKSLYGWRG